MPIEIGTKAPDFRLQDEMENWHSLSDYRGKPVVLYFYPKDDTPGCTREACGFRDDYSEYVERGVVILGVSPDTPRSHGRFKEKFQLPFSLLADDEHKVCDLYGVWGKKKLMGREFDGVLRTTFLIDPEGKVVQVFEKVRPAEHSEEILGYLNERM